MGLSKEIKRKVTAPGSARGNGHALKNPTHRKKSAGNGHANGSNGSNGSNGRTGHHDEEPDLLDDKELLSILLQVRNGNFTVRMPIGEVGVKGRIFDTLNEIISLNEEMMREFTKAGNTIGKQGKLTQRIEVPNAKGHGLPGWGHSTL